MKNVLVRFAKIVITILLTVGIIICVSKVLRFKFGDGIRGIETLYEQNEDSIDVLILGSSHAFEDFNTAILYNDYGIASYVLAGSVQPMWNSYFYLEEAIKTQNPGLIILEGFALSLSDEYSDNSRIIKNTYGINNPIDRLRALKYSAPSDELIDYIFEWRQWHMRYSEVTAMDFGVGESAPIYENYKGFGINFAIYPDASIPETVLSENGRLSIYPKQELFYRNIIELCAQKDIPIAVVISPYVLSGADMKRYNSAYDIAQEYGIPFYNLNDAEALSDMGFVVTEDMADTGHLNSSGNSKFTKYVAERIISEYSLPDRRGDEDYISWERHTEDVINRTMDNKLAKSADFEEIIQAITTRDNLCAYLYIASQAERLKDYCDNNSEYAYLRQPYVNGGLYKICNSDVSVMDSGFRYNYHDKVSGHNFSVNHIISANESNGRLSYSGDIKYDGKSLVECSSGVYIIIFDLYTEQYVCTKNITFDGDVTNVK